jgi:tetratricopeptide (TPR) repeat protein
MGKVAEAEQFLREGLRANPNSYEILFELGRVYDEDRHDPRRAQNLWEAALRQWQKQESGKAKPNEFLCIEIASRLSKLEASQGDYHDALIHMALWKEHSPDPAAVQKHIEEVQQKIAASKASGAASENHNRGP